MNFEIPREFVLAGRTWKVKRVGKRKWYGSTFSHSCEIHLSSCCDTPELLAHTFLHEVLHAVATAMGWTKFNEDEDKVDAMASLILQALTTRR